MRNALIGLGHMIAFGLIVIGILSAYSICMPLGFALDLLVIYLTKKNKTKS